MIPKAEYKAVIYDIRELYVIYGGHRFTGPIMIREIPAKPEYQIPFGDYTNDEPAATVGADLVRRLPDETTLDRTMDYKEYMSIDLEVYVVCETYSIICARTDAVTTDEFGYEHWETVGVTIYGIYDPVD